MFSNDPKSLSRLEPCVRRVIVADPNLASAHLLADILKGMGSREVYVESDQERILRLAQEHDPKLLLLERTGPRLDGEALTRRIRRSNLACRRMPIIMVTSEATASAILGARDAGVHEFLRKPFTAGDVTRRIETVAMKPRDWIEGMGYIGPDRRRFNSGEYAGPRKRKGDRPPADSAAGVKDQAMRILATALERFDEDPMQATRAMRQQADTLKSLALKVADARLAVAAAGLGAYLSGGAATKADLAGPVKMVLALAQPPVQAEPLAKAS